MKIIITIIILVSFNFYAVAQIDSLLILNYQDYIKIVLNEHPIAKQADIKINEGEANLLYARGAFDPKIYTDINQKYFKGDQYYSQIDGGLKIPTWFGIELKGGYEQNQGLNLNPAEITPSDGLLYAGISLPVGQGLFIDKRRAELKKAHLFQQVTEMERRIILNELVYLAGTTYWKWFKTYNTLMVYNDAYRLAKERSEAVKTASNLGDRPAIDILEAKIQVQNRLLTLQQSKLEFKNTSALLSIYLWKGGVIPLELAEDTVPISMSNVSVSSANKTYLIQLDSLINNHPELNQSRYKINQLQIDKRLKVNQLLPVLNLKYNPITTYLGNTSLINHTINNYTWGMEFQMPIFLRKERGALKLAKLKIQASNFKLINKQKVLRYKVIAAFNQWETTTELIDLYSQTVEDSGNLLNGEKKLFNFGESSLFKLNLREVEYIKTQLKLIELLTKNRKAELTTKFALGNY